MRSKRKLAGAVELTRKLAGYAPGIDPAPRPAELALAASGAVLARRYVYQALGLYRDVDGDTFWVQLDVGFRQTQLTEIRLWGYDTPEKHKGSDFERSESHRAAAVTTAWLTAALTDGNLWIRTEPDPDDFGRWLGETWVERRDGTVELLGDALRAEKLASVWPQRWRTEFDPAVVDGQTTVARSSDYHG